MTPDYDQVKLRAALAVALEPFIGPTTMELGKAAVVDMTTNAAFYSLRLICGSPSADRPRGILRAEDLIAKS